MPTEEENEGGFKGGLKRFHERGMENVRDTATEGLRGLSQGLMGSAFESFGKAFTGGGYTPRGMRPDDSGMANWRQMGAVVQAKMENRWHENEFKQFKKNMLDPFQRNITELLRNASNTDKMLQEGQIPIGEGQFEQVDMKNEAQRMKVLRLRNQIESDLMLSVMDMQVNLNNQAAEQYSTNPIVNNMIRDMMLKQTEMLSGQFRPMNQAKQEQDFRASEADIQYKQSLTRDADARAKANEAATKNQYTDAYSVMRDLGPAGASRYFTQSADGRKLLEEGTSYPSHVAALKTKLDQEFIRSNKWDAQTAELPPNKAAREAWINENAPRIEQRALGEYIKNEFGEDALQQAGQSKPGLLKDPEAPFEYDVKTNPSKKETVAKTDKVDALGVEAANEKLRRDPDMTKTEAVDWVMKEWLPAALDGTDLNTGGYLKQFDGLTADAKNKAAAPYIKAVRESLQRAAERFVGTGEGTEGLLAPQRPRRRSPRGGLSRTGSILIDKLTPDALFPEVGKDVYPPDFRKQFPKE